MELWIRSQDKETIIKIENISIDSENYIIGNLISDDNKSICDYWRLGHYKTKERALEVLDEIQNILKPTFKINYEYDDSQPIIDGEWLKSLKAESKIEELSCYVFEMPER